jgi:ADP-heptose:LPS heptosyltransferase
MTLTPIEAESVACGETNPAESDPLREPVPPLVPPPTADRVLVIRLGAVGDVVRTLPSVAALRSLYPGAHLAWLVEPAAAGVVDAACVVDETLIFPRSQLTVAMRDADALLWGKTLFGFLRTLRQRRFEIVVDFHGHLKSGILSRLSGAAIRYGYARPLSREGSFLFATHLVRGIDPFVSRLERNAALVREVSAGAQIPERRMLKASALAKARLTARLRATGRERSGGFALIHPGSSAGAQHKRYAPEAWVRVVNRLAEDGIEVWIAAGPNRDESSLAEAIVREAEGACVLAPETRSFDDLLALQSRAGVFIACDSGPLHAASLLGVPLVQLIGPTHPGQNEPWLGTPMRQLRVPLPCSPCRRGCGAPACMRAIPPSSVADAAGELLASIAVQRGLGERVTDGEGTEPLLGEEGSNDESWVDLNL